MDSKKVEFKQKVRSLQHICGSHVCLGIPVLTELMGSAGFDYLWIDAEHTTTSLQDLQYCIAAAENAGAAALVRVPENDRTFTKKILEMGPGGIIFPMVKTKDDADRLIASTIDPPLGNRGFGPLRAVGYGKRDANEYIEHVNEELCRFIQIESIEAVDNLPEIVKNPYIDGYLFGPCDLSGSLGELNNVFGEKNLAAINRAIAILKDNGKSIGISTGSTDPEQLAYWHSLGINMISCGADFSYVLDGAAANLKNLRKVQQPS